MEVPFVSLGAGSSMAFPSGNQDFTFFVLREVQGSWVPYSFFFFFVSSVYLVLFSDVSFYSRFILNILQDLHWLLLAW